MQYATFLLNQFAEVLKRRDATDQLMLCTCLGLKHVFPLVPTTDYSIALLQYIHQVVCRITEGWGEAEKED